MDDKVRKANQQIRNQKPRSYFGKIRFDGLDEVPRDDKEKRNMKGVDERVDRVAYNVRMAKDDRKNLNTLRDQPIFA